MSISTPSKHNAVAYDERLKTLSEGSVHKRFDPYVDIDWDSPEFAVTPDDERWILPDGIDPFGSTEWYKSQSRERQIEIGRWRQANIAKVGLQFENVLIRGMIEYVFWLPNQSAEYRYCTHECIEECNHTLMFQEMVNRLGMEVPGARPWFKFVAPFIPLAGRFFPIVFFMGVLGGEEPIDHIQKSMLRGGKAIHPILHRVMEIHVAEEARHISFAHEHLKRVVPNQPLWKRIPLSIGFPIVMRILCDAIVIPPPAFRKEFDIPKSVLKDVFWRSPEARQTLRNYFGDVRMLAHDAGLMNPLAKLAWKAMRIDGDRSRYRSEPHRRAA